MSTRSLRVRRESIETAKLAVRRSSFLNQRALAEDAGLALATVSNFLTGRPVDRATFVELCQKLALNPKDIADLEVGEAAAQTPTPTPNVDWGEALDVSHFYEREKELVLLEQWLLDDECRLVMLLGMGGIGKTALSVRLAEQLQDEFEWVIWRSLRNAPPVQALLADLLSVLAPQREVALPDSLGGSITRLLEHLRTGRCLLVLDNAESILGADDRAGIYREGYEGYGQLLQCVGEARHRSCFVLTSREKPSGLGAKEGHAIRALKLTGLGQAGAQAILQAKGVTVPVAESRSLIEHYAGNPLALKIVATTIQDLFEGDVAQFLAQDTGVFGDLADLLEQQWQRLSALEQQVMVWLAINREGVLLADLKADIIPVVTPRSLMEALESLQQRSLVEKTTNTLTDKKAVSFTQQPVVMEYVTEQLVRQVCEALVQADLSLLQQYALSKAQTKDYLRQAQQRLILSPLIAQLQAGLGSQAAVQECLQQTLARLQVQAAPQEGYAAGNLLKLFGQLKVNLSGSDFSRLPIWQVYLQGVPLQHVNFTGADFSKSVFTQTLGDILAVTFSPDGTLLATGIDRDVLLWQIAGTRQLATLAGHTAWITSIAFSPDGNMLASNSNDHTIRLWDVPTGQCLITLRGHTSGVQTIAFSPDGNLLASGSNDYTIRLWNVETRQCVQVLKGHTERVLSVLFSPDHQTLMSSGDDQTIRLWHVQSGEC